MPTVPSGALPPVVLVHGATDWKAKLTIRSKTQASEQNCVQSPRVHLDPSCMVNPRPRSPLMFRSSDTLKQLHKQPHKLLPPAILPAVFPQPLYDFFCLFPNQTDLRSQPLHCPAEEVESSQRQMASQKRSTARPGLSVVAQAPPPRRKQ